MLGVGFGAFGKKINTETESLPSFLVKRSAYSKTLQSRSVKSVSTFRHQVFGFNTEHVQIINSTGYGISMN